MLATVTWVVGSLLVLGWLDMQRRHDWADAYFKLCATADPLIREPLSKCFDIKRDMLAVAEKWPFPWAAYYLIGLAPVPFAWLGGWILLKLARWIRRGFALRSA